jgi:hypothetical protein
VNRRRVLLVATLALAATPAPAQDVQRCESADGGVSYANDTCPPGTTAVRTVTAAGAPNAADQKAAQQRAQPDMRRAAEIDRARQAEEQRALRQQEQAQAKAKKQETHCRRLQTRLRQAQEELAESRPPKQAEAQRRVRRAEELYREDCGAAKM